MQNQLPLGIGLPDSAVFTTFHAGANATAVATVAQAAAGSGERVVYLHGVRGTGKTHLLQAACAAATAAGRRAALLPLSEVARLAPGVIEGWERFDLVCIDDLHRVAGIREWEVALFELYNALQAEGVYWIGTGADAPAALGLTLPDLASRLAAGPVFNLVELDDDGRIAALSLRAAQRGVELPPEVGRYLLNHLPRDMATLHDALVRLDQASLVHQRRITLPLAREVLSAETRR
jgi:DnaA family protein